MTAFKLAVGLLCLASAGAAAQQGDSVTSPAAPDDAPGRFVDADRCISVPRVTDMDAFSDRHLYIKTRDGRQYLMTTEQCDNLVRSSERRTVLLVPYGREVCQNDGSYLLYDAGGLERPCRILNIRPVADRAEARDAAQGNPPPIEVREVPPTPVETP